MSYGLAARFPAPGQVLIRDGCVRWHATRACDERDAREGEFAYRCSLDAAYRSSLVPCPACASGLTDLASTLWGPTTAHDRARMPMPRLLLLTPEREAKAARKDRQLVASSPRRP